jgi:membrane protease YdiL (CAAX protease family)
LAGILLAVASVYFSDLVGSFTKWSEENNPFFAGDSSDVLGLLPFIVIAVVLYLVGREIIFANRKNDDV